MGRLTDPHAADAGNHPARFAVPGAMTNRPIRLAFGLPILAASLLLAAPGAALADCMQPPPIELALSQAEIVFVGTVTATSNRNSWAEVAVEDV